MYNYILLHKMIRTSDIKQIDLDWLYWYFKLGTPKNKITSLELTENINKYIQVPIFFLSTGRCGTKWFSNLLQKDKNNAIFHSPTPTLAKQSKKIFKLYYENNFIIDPFIEDLLKELIFASRENYFRYTYKTNKRYIETNNYITFFAPILKTIFPDAIFIELTRDPLSFIKSAYNRNYYSNSIEDNKRPTDTLNNKQWNKYNRIEKIAWLWNNTYKYIETFSNNQNTNTIRFNFNQLTFENVSKLLNILSINISEKQILKQIPNKVNTQKNKKHNLNDEITKNINSIKTICNEQALRLNYKI